MMGIFDGIPKKLPPLKDYLYFMFENKQGSSVGSRKEEEKFFPLDLLRSDFFILHAKILSILTYFLLISHEKQRLSS